MAAQPNASTRDFEPLLTTETAAELMQIHPKVLQRMARRGEIPALKVGKFWRFRSTELDAWVRSRIESIRQPCHAEEPLF
jgi:excisionase family DNA binding protein